MNHQTTNTVSRTAIIAILAITGCFSQSKSAVSATSEGHSGATATAGASTHGNSTRTVSVDDPATHMRAFTLQVPAGWKFTGMIAYPGGCHAL
jgi:hypothetical protein